MKFCGKIGYSITKELSPGVWGDEITDRRYYGDIMRNPTSQMQSSESLNDNLNITNQISIVADPFTQENFYAMRYVEFMGAKWKITNVEIQYPRLILTVGGVYNEQTAETT